MKSAKLAKVRDLAASVVRELSTEWASTEKIVEEVRRRYPNEIEDAANDLLTIALKRVVNDVSDRKASTSFSPGQTDLFARFADVPAQVSLKIPGEEQPQRKDTTHLTYDELYAWYKEHTKKRAVSTKRAQEVRRLLKRIKPFATGNVTVQEALAAADAAEEKAEKKTTS